MHQVNGTHHHADHGEHDHRLDVPPGDIVFLSAADTDLAILAAAQAGAGEGPSLRLANLMRLNDLHAVEHLIDDTLSHARLIVVRVLGGVGYWQHGLEALQALARGGGPALAILPHEDRWDDGLHAYASVDVETCRTLWRYFVEGGRENGARALAFLRHMLDEGDAPPAPDVLPPAGDYRVPGLAKHDADAPVAAIVFYRSVLHAGSTEPIDRLAEALQRLGLRARPIFVASVKNRASAEFLEAALAETPPAVVLNTTAFAVGRTDRPHEGTVLDRPGAPVLQVVLSGQSHHDWEHSLRGLPPRDLTMNVVLPEVDGRILTRAISFKEGAEVAGLTVQTYCAAQGRVDFVAQQAAAIVDLARATCAERRVAVVLSNYPDRDGRIGNGVGLDAPESAARLVAAMADAGYAAGGFPATSADLMAHLLSGPTNAPRDPDDPDATVRRGGRLPLADYRAFLDGLPHAVRGALEARWGAPETDRSFRDGGFDIAAHRFGNVVIGIQPARGYGADPMKTYHDPDLVPPHGYLAFYVWLRGAFAAHAVLHLGKHGNLEWLPGKALGLSESCWPEVALGPTPLVYPFIVNDPGEGSQAKRRSSAVIVDHLMPAMTRAEVHGDLSRLETLVDEYYLTEGVDHRRREYLGGEILSLAASSGLDRDLGIAGADDAALQAIDAHLCDLKEMQIRDGLHIFGTSPSQRLRTDTLVTLARTPRSGSSPEAASLHRAIADDLDLGFDPLACEPASAWTGPRPEVLADLIDAPWRTAGDTVERIEALAAKIVDEGEVSPLMSRTAIVRDWIARVLAPALDRSGADEFANTLTALDGRFVAPGPSGAPTRGRPDVLPTGRNFYSVDVRGVPTAAAWELGRRAAHALAERIRDDSGDWPRSIAMSAWGTSNMRTGGDDIAQVMALIGARPVWEGDTGRVTGFEVIPLADLGRPRIDVTLRISGMFRDAFPDQTDLLATAFRTVAGLDEPAEANPLAASGKNGADPAMAAAARIFGAKPGAYGAGLQALIDEGGWESRKDFAEAFLAWGGFAYGSGDHGRQAAEVLAGRLKATDAVYQNQDNREHDILDSDDYYQFQGGLAATVEAVSGQAPAVYHGDTSRPEKPVVRALSEEIARVVRGRAANPKWIAGMMRHGYKGAFEMAATVDYLFAFAATTDAVGDQHFDQLYTAYLEDDLVRGFVADANAPALREMALRFREAIDRGLWSPRSNSAYDWLSSIIHRPADGSRTSGTAEQMNGGTRWRKT